MKNPARGGVRWQGRGFGGRAGEGLGGLVDLVGHLSAHGQHVERARCDGLKGRIIQRLHDAGSPALKLLPGDALPVLHVHQGVVSENGK